MAACSQVICHAASIGGISSSCISLVMLHASCRYQRLLRKLSRKQRLKMTGQYYTAPRGFFNMSQEMSKSARQAANQEAAEGDAPRADDGGSGADDALSIANDDQGEAGLLNLQQGPTCILAVSSCIDVVKRHALCVGKRHALRVGKEHLLWAHAI